MIRLLRTSASRPFHARTHGYVLSPPTARVLPAAGCRPDPSSGSPDPSTALKTSEPDSPAVAIAGPTASGKSALAVALAEALRGEVVNYDSVQLYRGFDVGSGKLTEAERRGIPHHLLGIAGAGDIMTAGEYRRRAVGVLESIRTRGNLPVLAGGTGLYLRSLTDGLFEGPARSEELRERFRRTAARRGCEFLHKMLRRLDAQAARSIHPRDVQKVIRALEVCSLAGQTISQLQAAGCSGIPGFRFIKIGLEPDRSLLYERINQRVARMFAEGLLEETRTALTQLEDREGRLPAPLQALGYRQALAVLRGSTPLSQAIHDAQTATRRYAKRQLTWFRKERGVCWFAGFGDEEATILAVLDHVRDFAALSPPLRAGEPLPTDRLHIAERENS